MRKIIVLLAIGLLVAATGCNRQPKTGTSKPMPSASGKPQTTTAQASPNQDSLPQNPGSISGTTIQQPATSTANSVYSSSIYYHSLLLPNGKLLTSYDTNSTQWEDLYIHLDTYGSSPGAVYETVGNHSTIVSQESVQLPTGPAILALVDRTPPAAAQSDTVTHECWLIEYGPTLYKLKEVYPSSYCLAYCIDATFNISPATACSEMLKVSKGWTIPPLQTKAP